MSQTQEIHFIELLLMLLVALIFDLLSLIPILNFVVWVFAWLTFWFWFKMKGISLITDKKRLLTVGGVSLIEIIPAISMLPSWIALVLIIYFINKAEKILLNSTKNENN